MRSRASIFSFRPVARGFTLIEILLTLALVALVGGSLLVGVNALLRANDRNRPEDILMQAMAATRELALKTDHDVRLRFDGKLKNLAWGDGVTSGVKAFPPEPAVSLQFLQPKSGATVLIGGQLVETQEVPFVTFYADGTCEAFRVQWSEGNAAPRIVQIDPWTCTVMLPAKP